MKKIALLFILIITGYFISNAQGIEIEPDSLAFKEKDSLQISTTHEEDTSLTNKLILDKELPEPIIPFLSPNYRVPDFNFEYRAPRFTYFEDEYLITTPFNFSYEDGYQGGWMGGVNNYMKFTDNFWTNLHIFASSSYFGPMYPHRYNNASFSLDMRLQIHERIRLVGFGQISLREGINPAFSPVINGGNHFGGGVEFKVAKGFGIGFGVVNSYYRKSWTTTPYATPVAW